MYSLNEKVVYPGQGVAKINRILEKMVAGNQSIFFELKFLNKDMTILVPIDNITSIGIRKLSSDEVVNTIFNILVEPVKKITHFKDTASSWNKRSKQYHLILRSGNLSEIAKIYKDLQIISQHKGLSFGEKNLLFQTEALLAQEIALVKNILQEQALEQLRSNFIFNKISQSRSTSIQI